TIKRAFRQRGQELQFSQNLGAKSTADLVAMIRANPAAFIAQETVSRSSAPVWNDGAVQSSHIAVRAFLVASKDTYTVMPGGLARVSSSTDPLELSILSGEGSKDLWVLANQPISPVSLLDKPGQPVELRRSGAELPSRVADNLYWLGRHTERADATVRLLRAITLRLTDEGDPAGLSELPSLLRVLVEQGQIEPGFLVDGMREQLPTIEQMLPRCIFDETHHSNLRSVLSQMFRLASIVRDRMSVDTWRILCRIDEQFRPPSSGSLQLSDVLPLLSELIIELAAFHGMVMESMTRTQGWRFLDLGRRLERGMRTISLVKNALASRTNIPSSLLEAVLEIADSRMTYRSRYLANLQLGAVLDLLLTDETNPRSVAYQLVMLADHVEKLPRDRSQPTYAAEQRLAMHALHTMRMVDVQSLAERHAAGERYALQRLLENFEALLPQLSDAVSLKYLIHAGSPHQLDEIRPE
ncbi:MAG: circularly permuted type 2 ATP-grasp protein, partial [Planctomycetia bacterium]|nr:circularly permuted type 2 ATP-grasp protein [Planctomycetia bacterium]